jgi:hypothetical protein
VRGLHATAPSKRALPAALDFIRGPLADAGVNTLILEFNATFDFKSRPEFADPSALNRDDVRQIAKACRDKRIQLIPMINCLGHQSWAERNDRFLTKHPEFDETPGKFPNNKGIYCRSYCPLHPEIHAVLFDLMDELIEASSAKAFHIGMDEVFLLADPDCPRCRGKDPAKLFADEVKRLRDHLKSKGCRTWIWGDRFLDGKATGLGEWEASMNATAPSIDLVPRDIVICDWHYDAAPDTARLFAAKGFDVVGCPWRKIAPATGQLAHIRDIRAGKDRRTARHALGMVQTTWCGFDGFMNRWNEEKAGARSDKSSASEVVACFNTLFEAMQSGR